MENKSFSLVFTLRVGGRKGKVPEVSSRLFQTSSRPSLRAELFHHREETNMVSRPCVLARALARSPPYPPAMTVRAGLWCIYSCSGRRGQA